jgi:TRAP-type uncharacterized transport system substrate-binding protein
MIPMASREPSKNGVMSILKSEQVNRRLLLISATIVATLTAVGVWLAFSLLRPTPPRLVAMAVDPQGSFDAEVGKRYRELFARDGIDLRLVPTAGAVDSIARLRDPKSGISIAIIPGGITNRDESPRLLSLGTLFYEPLWLFSHNQHLETHEQLRNFRISIGPEGSASHKLALEFLASIGVFEQKSATLLSLTPQESSAKLLNGDIDAAVLMGPWETPTVRQLLVAKDIDLVPIRRADAFVDLYPFLNKLVLPAGVADLAQNRPPKDVLLIAPKASLVVRDDLHPAIQYLLLEAASQTHSGPGVFHKEGQFPASESIDLPLSSHARQFYKTGSPFLQRNLPFWLAVLVQQVLVLLLPVVGVLYPLLRVSPGIFMSIQSRRVYGLYSELRLLERELASAVSAEDHKDFIERLDQLEDRASGLWVPPSLRPHLYNLRLHIRLVREEAKK